MSELLVERFNASLVIAHMRQDGAYAVSGLVSEELRLRLLEAAMAYDFNPDAKVDEKSVDNNPLFRAVGSDLEGLVNGPLKHSPEHPLQNDVSYQDSVMLNRYLPGARLTMHIDEGCFGVICSVQVSEKRGLYASPASVGRWGLNRRRIPTNPGDVVFMMGIGFDGNNFAIDHQVTKARSLGFSLVYRSQS